VRLEGEGAAGYAAEAGLHVFCFSDGVSLADEVVLKRRAVELGLLFMGADCGTAIIDGVGGSTFEQSLACLKRRGLLVSYGTAGGLIPPFDLFRLNRMGSLYVTSAGLADYIHDRSEMLERAEDLFAVMKTGAVKVPVNQRYPLAEAARAHVDLEGRRTSGSSILLP
jgi:NADPH:quinone reductase